MAKTRYITDPKKTLVIPIVAKSVYPFVNDKKISTGLDKSDYIILGRLVRPIKNDEEFRANLCIQCYVSNSSTLATSRLKLKYEVTIKGGTQVAENKLEEFFVPIGFNNLIQKEIYFENTKDNTEILLTIYGINETSITSVSPNIISLVYLEKKEE